MPVLKSEWEAERARRGIPKWRVAEVLGVTPSILSVELRKPYVPDTYMEALEKIAPGTPKSRLKKGREGR